MTKGLNMILHIAVVLSLMPVLSCSNTTDAKFSTDDKDTAPVSLINATIDATPFGPSDSTIHRVDSILNNGQLFKVFFLQNETFLIRNQLDRIIYSSTEVGGDFRFEDFNKDGYADIVASSLAYLTGAEDLLLFDTTSNTFRLVEDFRQYSFVEKIEGTKYMSSYKATGCADMNWNSDLFYIDGFKAVRQGVMQGFECEYDPESHGVFIYRVDGDSGTLVTKLPISTIHRFKNGKVDYISQYWKNNYRKFIR